MKALTAAVARRSLRFGSFMSQPYAEGSMNSTVRITRYREQGFDEDSRERTPGAAIVIYEGIASFQATSGAGAAEFGDEQLSYDSGTFSIPVGSRLPRVDDIVRVLSGPDARANTREFKVDSVAVAGRMDSSILLQATGLAPSRQWQDEDDVAADL